MTFHSRCAATVLAALALSAFDAALAIDPAIRNPNAPSSGGAGSSIPVVPISTSTPHTHTTSSFNPSAVNPSIITSPPVPAGVTDPGRTRVNPLASATPTTGVNPLLAPTPGTPTNPQQRRNRWRLGVYSTDTDMGVKIVEVVPNSPAQRVGLEPNDTIITVNGFQVGFVGGTHYDTGSEFDRLASEDGQVMLLVRNQRNGQLVNVPIQLESRFSALTGTIGYRERSQLPQGAICTVELREITRPNAPPIALASRSIAITQVPIQFRLEYDPADIVARRSYFIHATISAGSQQLYTTTASYQVLNGTPTQQIAMTLDPVVVSGSQTVSRDQQLEEILRLYQAYLQRDPRQTEYDVLTSRLERGQTIRDVQLDLLSGNEYYFRCEADDQLFVNQLHQEFLNRPAQPAEMQYWLTQLDAHGGLRRDVTRDFLVAINAPQW